MDKLPPEMICEIISWCTLHTFAKKKLRLVCVYFSQVLKHANTDDSIFTKNNMCLKCLKYHNTLTLANIEGLCAKCTSHDVCKRRLASRFSFLKHVNIYCGNACANVDKCTYNCDKGAFTMYAQHGRCALCTSGHTFSKDSACDKGCMLRWPVWRNEYQRKRHVDSAFFAIKQYL